MWVAWICLGVRMVISVDYFYSNMGKTGRVGENPEVVVEGVRYGAAVGEG